MAGPKSVLIKRFQYSGLQFCLNAPYCMTGNLWLVNLDGLYCSLCAAQTRHKFPVTECGQTELKSTVGGLLGAIYL